MNLSGRCCNIFEQLKSCFGCWTNVLSQSEIQDMTALTQRDRNLLACRSYRELLKRELDERCARKELYSMRAMARDLEVSVSGLSGVLNGKSHFSKSTIFRVAFRLQKPDPVESYFINLALAEIEAPGDDHHPNYLKAREIRLQHVYANADVPHRMLSSWSLAPMALKLLLGIKDEVKTNEALQKRLGVTEDQLKQMLDELESIGWIERSSEGPGSKLRFVELGNKGNAYDIRSMHRKAFNYALQCLDNKTVDERNFYTTFFTMAPKDAEKVREQLRKYALTLSESQDDPVLGHEVYSIGTFLVPLTQPVDRA
jgi:uncharacterized protein (TIGR02147 family)